MPKFLVRMNCEYSTVIEAESAELAIAKAQEVDTDEWDQTWSPIEIDDEELEFSEEEENS